MADHVDKVLSVKPVREAPSGRSRSWTPKNIDRAVLIGGRVLLIFAILALWQIADGRFLPDFVISSPTHVAARLVHDLQRRTIWNDILVTAEELVMGYTLGAVIGVVLGLLLGLNRIVRGIFEPVLSAVNAIPKVALAPLFLIAMGLGPASKVAIAAMMVALLMFYNTLGGVLMAPRPLVDVLRVMGAGRGVILRKVLLPFLSTYIIAGLKSSVPLAIVGVIVGEFIGADAGIGFYIRQATSLFDAAGLFSGVFILIVMTLIGNGLVQLLESRLLRWRR
ncbi:MAG TPA: ABC transporter permease [Beijerinckiaceae bacterium]|nr:ABC transporter permease [Beijerinckiaceae bacterium]